MVRSTLNRAEAKYNVTTEFTSLGLHSAAASGDVGLVEYALNHGQPINSVLDGVLPLHAACAGGNTQVVKLLIDHGADVNAQRLPRKYSSERNRDSSMPIVGTTGSTPLHFAAANGNLDVLNLLLLHGAHADRADKHGITPEMIAEENGWVECSAVLRDWIANKDKDLRERQAPATMEEGSDTSWSPPLCRSKRLPVKRSMDTALAMVKTTETPWRSREAFSKSPGEHFVLSSPPSSPPVDLNGRRPSLPQILPTPPSDTLQKRLPGATDPPRPQSAGTGAEQDDPFHNSYGRGGAARKQGNKPTLMHIFKKTHQEGGLEFSMTPSDGVSAHDSPALSSAPIPGSAMTLPLPVRSSYSSNSSHHNLPETPDLPATAPLHSSLLHKSSDPLLRSRRYAAQSIRSPSALPKLPNLSQNAMRPLAIEVQLALANQSKFKIGGIASLPSKKYDFEIPKGSTAHLPLPLFEDQDQSTTEMVNSKREGETSSLFTEIVGESERKTQPNPSSRLGILRAHNRTTSSGQGSPLPRTLRFDSSSSIERKTKESPRGTPTLRHSASSTSMSGTQSRSTKPESLGQDFSVDDGKHIEGDEEDESYGQIISSSGLKLSGPSMLLQRTRGLSFGSSSDAELSPIDSVSDTIAALKSDFPFSIHDRPPNTALVDGPLPIPRYLSVPVPSDKRGRGDSLSSNSTTSDNRSNSYASSSGRGTTSTPALSSVLASPLLSDKMLDRIGDVNPSLSSDDHSLLGIAISSSQSTKRPHTPSDMDINTISSHAQAEALVQQTRQDVLELAGQEMLPISVDSGHTPLSARLAAYGESLALEKKLREQREVEERDQDIVPATEVSTPFSSPLPSRKQGVERQHSLRERSTASRHRRPQNDPRRPSTAEGVISTRCDHFARDIVSAPRSSHPAPGLPNPHTDVSKALSAPCDRDTACQTSIELETSSKTTSESRCLLEAPPDQRNFVDGAETNEVDTIGRIMAVPVSDLKKSAMKLTRMGYPAEATAPNKSTSPPPVGSMRFGAFKTFMQNFRGKT